MGFPLFAIAQLRHYAQEMRSGVYDQQPSGHVEEVCARPAEDFETTARRYVANPGLIYPGLELGSFASALWFIVRMLATPAPDLDAWEARRDYPSISRGELAHDNPAWVQAAKAGQLVLQPGS